jgi:DNA-binding NarL/FixJ family response regulator
MNKIRLLLIEDNRLLRDGIVTMLKGHRNIHLVAASGNGVSAIPRIYELKPNVILLDLGLRSQSSLHLLELVTKEFPSAKVIVMDLAPSQGDVLQFIKAGASGFILKDATFEDFLFTINAVAEGRNVLPPILNGTLFLQIVDQAVQGGRLSISRAIRMTKREEEVIGFICEGLSNKEIARELHVATYTIKSHIHNIMEKLALHTRLEVANYALGDGRRTNGAAKSSSPILNLIRQ